MSGCASHAWQPVGRTARHPGVECEQPLRLMCGVCGEMCVIRCGSTHVTRCAPCGALYKKRVRRKSMSGFSEDGQAIFITLTAPGKSMHGDGRGGICPCTPEGGIDIAEWNPGAGKRWNRFLLYLARHLGCEIRVESESGKVTRKHGLRYFKAAEVQRRGALHFHAALERADGKPFVTSVSEEIELHKKIQALAIRWGFGHNSGGDHRDQGRLVVTDRSKAAGYVAKYVSKAAASRDQVPWATGRPGLRMTAAGRFRRRPATYRTWSSSRDWGDTMADIRAAQTHWARTMTVLPAWGDLHGVSLGWARLPVPAAPPGRCGPAPGHPPSPATGGAPMFLVTEIDHETGEIVEYYMDRAGGKMPVAA